MSDLIDLRECKQGDAVTVTTPMGGYYFISFLKNPTVSEGWVEGLRINVGNLSPRYIQDDLRRNRELHAVKGGLLVTGGQLILRAGHEWKINGLNRIVRTTPMRLTEMTGRLDVSI